MSDNNYSYNTILSRRSVRRFQNRMLSEKILSEMNAFIKNVEPLDKNRFNVKIYDYKSDAVVRKALGLFGRIMRPPHCAAPFTSGGLLSLVDLGYCTQLLVLHMWHKGIGSCYIGCAHRQAQVANLLGYSEETRIISFLVFGLPETEKNLRPYQEISQFFTKAKERKNLEELFIDRQIPKRVKTNQHLLKILESGRYAPSATNAQPWRFAIDEGKFVIYAHQNTIPKVYDLEQGYSLHDTGICMANMSKAGEALGTPLFWHLIRTEADGKQSFGKNVPIAYFSLEDVRS